MNLNDLKDIKSLEMPYIKNGESIRGKVKKIQKNGVIIWKNTCTVSYTIGTGIASITIIGDDNITYVDAATTSGTVEIPRVTTITCSAAAADGYESIEDTTETLEEGLPYSYSPTTTLKTYTIELSSTYGYWKDSNNITITSIYNVPHFTTITNSGQTITLNNNTYTFIVNPADNYYTYAFNTISIPTAIVTGEMTISGVATRSTRYYSLTLHNQSAYDVTYYVNGSNRGTLNSGSSVLIGNYTYKQNSDSVYFTYGGSTSTSLTRQITQNTDIWAEVDATYHENEWVSDTYYSSTSKPNRSYLSSNTDGNGMYIDGQGWTSYHAFRRSSSATHVRMKFPYDGYNDWFGPVAIPSDLPNAEDANTWINDFGEYGDHDWRIWVADSRYIGFQIRSYEETGAGNDDQSCITGLTYDNSTNWNEIYSYDDTVKMEVDWGHYKDPYYTYSCYWD